LPGNLVINGLTNVFGSNVALLQSNPDLPLLSVSSGSNGGASSIWAEDIGNIGTSNIAAVYANPTPGSGIVRIAVGQNGSPGPNLWDFNANGALTLPGGSQISETANVSTNITVNANAWAFGIDGILTLPGSLVTPNGANAVIGYTTGTAGAPLTITAGDGGIAATGWNSGEGGDLTITAGDAGSDIGNPSWGNIGGTLVLRGGNSTQPYHGSNVEIYSGNAVASPGVISLHTGTNQWTFGSTGNLTLPNSATIIAPNVNDLTLRVTGQYNICTLLTGGSGYGDGGSSSAVSGGSGTDMIVGYGYGLSGQVVNVGVTDPGTGYQDGDVLTMTAGNGGATFVITKYNTAANAGNDNTAPTDWIFGNDINLTLPAGGNLVGNLIVPGSITSSGASPAPYISGFSSISALTLSAPTLTNGNSNVTVNANSNLWTFDSTGNLTLPANAFAINYANGTQVSIGGGSGTPGGSNTQVQFNDSGNFGASANFAFDKSTKVLTVDKITANGAGLTSITGANVSGTVANATFALDAGNANFANSANSVNIANVTGLVLNQSTIYVGMNGNDTTGNGTVINPYLTISKAVDLVGDGGVVIVYPGEYDEDVTIDNKFAITISSDTPGGKQPFSPALLGNLTISGNSSSFCFKGIGVQQGISHTSSGTVYLSEFNLGSGNVVGALSKTGSGSLAIQNCSMALVSGGNITPVTISGAGNVIFSNVALGLLSVSNTSATVSMLSDSTSLQANISAGSLNIFNSVLYTLANSGSNAIVGTGGVVNVRNSIAINPNQTTARLNIGPSTVLAYDDFYFDKPNSNVGINPNITIDFQSIRLANTLTANGNLSVTGNVTGAYILGNGSELTSLPAPTVAQDITSTGDMSIMTYDGNIKYVNYATIEPSSGNVKTSGNMNATGNISANYLIGNGATLTYITGSNVSGQVSNALISGTVYTNAQPNITSLGTLANLTVSGTSVTGVNSILAGPTFTPLANTMSGFVSNVNSYTQLTIQNKSTGTDATTDFVATADNGTDTVNYLDLGIINSGYDNGTPTNSLGNIVYAADSYLYAQGNVSNTSQSGGNLAIGTTVAGKSVKIFAGGANANSIIATVSNTGLAVTGNVTATNFSGNISITGNVTGTSANVTLVAGSYSTIFDNTGVATFPGNVSISGNFLGNGAALTGVAVRTTGTWTVATGINTYSITVPINGNYQLWVRGNIPNGIIAYQATVSVTNTNVPVLGTQRAWNYTGGGSPILITTMPTQIVGAEGTISTTVVSTTTANRFDFIINNSSGSSQTIYWGYVTL
jgi:hypothetical protein